MDTMLKQLGSLTLSLLTLITCFANPGDCISTGLTLHAHEGDTVFIPCSFLTSKVHIFWTKDGISPDLLTDGRSNFRRISTGLLANEISLNDTGNYQCYTHDNENVLLYSVDLIILSSVGVSTDPIEAENIPENLVIQNGHHFRVTENDAVFLPCKPALGTQNITVWGIDGVLYPSIKLPQWHLHHLGGILVDPVMQETTGLVYECYSNSMEVIYTIYLSIQPNNGNITQIVTSQSDISNLELVSRDVSFNDTFKNFAFKLELGTNSLEVLGTTEFITEVEVRESDGENMIVWQDTSDIPFVSIPNRELRDDRAYIATFVVQTPVIDSATLNYIYRINENQTTKEYCASKNRTLCVYLPANTDGLSIIWPTYPNSDEDCSCPIFMERTDGPRFKDCYCFRHNFTTYSIELENDRVCFRDLNDNSNNTTVLLVRDTPLTVQNLRTFESQIQIKLRGPGPPLNFIYDENRNEVCIAEPERSQLDQNENLLVTVNDITNIPIFNQKNVITTKNCFTLNSLPGLASCAPFKVAVSPANQCVEPKQLVTQGNKDSNVCDCLLEKVSIDILNITNVTSDEIVITINSSCSKEYDTHSVRNISLTATVVSDCSSCKNVSTYFDLNCEVDQPYEVTITDVLPLTQYNLTAEWRAPVTIERICSLGEGLAVTTRSDGDALMSSSVTKTIFMLVVVVVLIY